ncbi:MAG: hypothetical protein VKJ46_07875, partial [Leptolyngbyaceae bacterium]|nr:hypothetical protein [Leptolyngbyaceae bacterium]
AATDCLPLENATRLSNIFKMWRPHFQFCPTLEAATWHALERARLIVNGRTPAFQDGQIAAIASVNNLILVTNNVSDYTNFQNLKIENWFTP